MGEPADSPAVPKRRRRWLIGVVVLGIASLGTWWYWPIVDQRMVGRWGSTGGDLSFKLTNLKLTADGEAEAIIFRERKARIHKFPWRRQGSSFVICRDVQSRWAFWNRLMAAAYSRTQNPIFLGRESYSMEAGADGSIKFVRTTDDSASSSMPSQFSLTRVPE